MSGFDENPFGEPTIDNPFAVSIFLIFYASNPCIDIGINTPTIAMINLKMIYKYCVCVSVLI